jgi:hypothetical protein
MTAIRLGMRTIFPEFRQVRPLADSRMTLPGRTYRAAPRAPVGRRPSTRIGNSQVVAP